MKPATIGTMRSGMASLVRKSAALLLLLLPLGVSAQTPQLVQTVYCPNSTTWGGVGAVTNGVYTCPINPTLAGDFIVVHTFWNPNSTTTATLTDSASNSYTQDITNGTANSNVQRIYHLANVPAGITYVKISFSDTTQPSKVGVIVSEWNNVATSSPLDVAQCNSGTSTTITAGAGTIGTSNDLVIQHLFSDDYNPSGALSAGSQSGITWAFGVTDRNDGAGFQWGVYGSTGSFDPTFTQGSNHEFASCFAAYKTASSGSTPSGNRILSVTHDNTPVTYSSPYVMQVPLSGNLQVISFLGGTTYISGISSTPSCTWTPTGPVFHSAAPDNETQFYYATNCTGNSVVISATMDGPTEGDTFMIYDVTGPNPWSLDIDSGGETGNIGSQQSTITTCSGCLTPSTSTGVAFANFGQDFCTATGLTAPSGGVFDTAVYTGNSNNGAQSVDENNGWAHLFYGANPGPLTFTFNEVCSNNPQGYWAGRVAAFKTAAASSSPNPPTNLTAVVH